jgi:radical SAM superfamily enzyme YgiQ (UPF0313 family)
MSEIVLTTFNAKYAHCAFGLRYLKANLGELAGRTSLLEFEIHDRVIDAAEQILAFDPKVVGLGVYIWNVQPSTELVRVLKRLNPSVIVVVGGPEVSYEVEDQEICRIADFVVKGEADLSFAELASKLIEGRRPLARVIDSAPPIFAKEGSEGVVMPYRLYDDRDITQRVVYVEASRGCPFKCEFCLSSLDVPVRQPAVADFLREMQSLLDRGTRRFKFVDRTFNLNLNVSREILQFFLDRLTSGLFLHFEMIPDRLPPGLRELIARFPPGVLQFEVGIQTFNPEVEKLISRRQDHARLEDNLRWLASETGVHVHADLIVGLPGEDVESFGRGFDRLVGLGPQEIQVGILKRLRGTPIVRHDEAWGMVYSPNPPYEVLSTKLITFGEMQRMRRFSRYWDLIGNSGNFVATLPLLLRDRPFARMSEFCDWLYGQTRATHALALPRLQRFVFDWLVFHGGVDAGQAASAVWSDIARLGRSDRPDFLQPWKPWEAAPPMPRAVSAAPRRQQRHLRSG